MLKWFSTIFMQPKLTFSSLLLFAALCLIPLTASASYQPGQTLNPSCLPSDPTCIVVPSTASSTNISASFQATSTTATSTFAGNVSVAGTSFFSGNVTTGPILTAGSSLFPVFQNAFGTSVSTTLGSADITVANPAGIQVGMNLYGNTTTFPQPIWVTAVNGNTITMSALAGATNASIGLQFGYNRWDTTSSALVNTLGAKSGYFGTAAVGNSTWPNEYLSGSDQPNYSTLYVVSPTGGIGVYSASRTSDAGLTIPEELLNINDSTAHKTTWGQYIESHSENSSTGLTFNGEYSILNHGSVITNIDPYTTNVNGMTENLRLDCGTGAANPLTCSDALHILNNGATYGAGIVIANNTLATSTSVNPPAIALPAGTNGYAIDWYTAAGSIGWSLFSDATSSSPTKQLELSSNSLNILNSNVGIGTASPGAKLEVNGSIRVPDNIASGSFNIGSIGSYLGRQASDGSTLLNTQQGYIGFLYQGSERMRIDGPTGNFGIGTTSPATRLSVAGSGYLTGGLGVGILNTTAGTFQTAGNSTIGGNESVAGTGSFGGTVGIGTTTPAVPLQVAAAGNAQLRLGDGTGAFYFDIGRNAGTGAFTIQGNNGSAQNIALAPTSGNVGIGTTSPATTLSVAGNGYLTGGLGVGLLNTTAGTLQTSGNSTIGGNESVTGNGYFAGSLSVGTSTPSSQFELFGTGQTTANLTDAGSRNDVLELFTNGGNNGNGGAIAFGNSQSQNAGSIGFAAIKGLLTTGGGNTTGDLTFSTRNSFTDTNLTERMRITQKGNIAIGTSTPYGRLTIWGLNTASSTLAFNIVNNASTTVFAVFDGGNAQLSGTLTQSSDARLKTNIQSLDASTSLAAIDSLTPVDYDWLDPNKGGTRQYGFIAQQVQQVFPNLVSTTSATALTPDGTLGLNYIGLIAPIVEAIQTLSAEVSSLEATVAGFAQSFTTHQLNADELCLDGTCISKTQLQALLANQSGTPSVQISAPILPTISGTTTPPSINIQGNNPATINVGDTYTDLGAIVHDNQGHDLSYRAFINGVLSGNILILIDTSQMATDTIDYVATDTWGNTSTSTRTVIIEAATSSVQ
jgi:Chaperone of endosialidase/Domain of unknown function (DUF5011)